MTTRKRDNFGRFSAGGGGTDLARFGKESFAYKKSRNMGVQPSMPGYPGAVGAMRSSQAPPDAGALGVGYSSGVIDLGSNSTSSVPIQARPWSAVANIPPVSSGALLFVRRDSKLVTNGLSNQLRSVADLPTMNWLLREAISQDVIVEGGTKMDSNSHYGVGSVLGTRLKPNTGWNFAGSLRNEYQADGSPVKLYNVDVFGRSKVRFDRSLYDIWNDFIVLTLVSRNPFYLFSDRQYVRKQRCIGRSRWACPGARQPAEFLSQQGMVDSRAQREDGGHRELHSDACG